MIIIYKYHKSIDNKHRFWADGPERMQRSLHFLLHYLNLSFLALENTGHRLCLRLPQPQQLTFRERINAVDLFGGPDEDVLDNQQEGEEEGEADYAEQCEQRVFE